MPWNENATGGNVFALTRQEEIFMSKKTGGAGGGGKQDSRKKGKVTAGGRNKELERKLAPKRYEKAVKT
jgi:hypothetical protein